MSDMRLVRIERELWCYRLILIFSLFIVPIASCNNRSNSSTVFYDSIIAKKIQLLDDNDKVAVSLFTNKDGGAISVMNSEQNRLLHVKCVEGLPLLGIVDMTQGAAAVASISASKGGGGALILTNPNANVFEGMITIDCQDGPGKMAIWSRAGVPVFEVTDRSDLGTTLNLKNPAGEPVVELQSNKRNEGEVLIRDANGRIAGGIIPQ